MRSDEPHSHSVSILNTTQEDAGESFRSDCMCASMCVWAMCASSYTRLHQPPSSRQYTTGVEYYNLLNIAYIRLWETLSGISRCEHVDCILIMANTLCKCARVQLNMCMTHVYNMCAALNMVFGAVRSIISSSSSYISASIWRFIGIKLAVILRCRS